MHYQQIKRACQYYYSLNFQFFFLLRAPLFLTPLSFFHFISVFYFYLFLMIVSITQPSSSLFFPCFFYISIFFIYEQSLQVAEALFALINAIDMYFYQNIRIILLNQQQTFIAFYHNSLQLKSNCMNNHYRCFDQYVFCYSQNNPQTLVMLDKPERIPQLIINQPQDTLMLWVGQLAHQQHFRIINAIQAKLNLFVFTKKDPEDIKIDITQKRTTKSIVIICTPDFYGPIVRLKQQYSEIHKVICYTTDAKYPQDQEIQFLVRGNQDKLIDWVQEFKKITKEDKILPNFLFSSSIDAVSSNKLVSQIIGMLRYEIFEQVRLKIIDKLEEVINIVQQKNSVYNRNKMKTKIFLNQLRNGIGPKEAIKWYTCQTVVNKFVNNLLRATRNSTQVFYLLPFFNILFQGIETLHKQQHSKGFSCYRGGIISEQQIKLFEENKNRIVQNLGFLSTSMSLDVGQRFAENVLFQILVDEDSKGTDFNFGYADVSCFSEFYQEREVLFNPLNVFKILDLGYRDDDTYTIKLQHCPKIDETNGIFLNYLGNWKKNHIELNCYQGKLIGNQGEIGAEPYFQKLLQITQAKIKKQRAKIGQVEDFRDLLLFEVQALMFYSHSKNCEGQYEQAYQISKKSYNLVLNIQDYQKTRIYPEILKLLALNLQYTGQYALSQHFYEKVVQIRKRNIEDNLLGYLISLANLGNSYIASGIYKEKQDIFSEYEQKAKSLEEKYESLECLQFLGQIYLHRGLVTEALEQYEKCLSITEKSIGTFHRKSLSLLHTIGKLNCLVGNIQKGLNSYGFCLNFYSKNLDQSRSQYKNCLKSLSVAYIEVGKVRKAEKIIRFLIEQERKAGRQKHPQFFELLINLAIIYQNNNKMKEVFLLYQYVLEKQKESIGVYHTKYLLTLDNFSLAYLQHGYIRKSLQLNNQSIKVLKAQGKQNLNFFRVLNNRALIKKGDQKLKESQRLFSKCLALGKKIHGLSHSSCLAIVENMIEIFKIQRRLKSSISLSRQIAKLLLNKIGKTKNCLKFLSYIGYLYRQTGEIGKSINFYTQSILLRIKRKELEGKELFNNLQALAICFQQNGDSKGCDRVLLVLENLYQIKKQNKFGKSWLGKMIEKTICFLDKNKLKVKIKVQSLEEINKLIGELNFKIKMRKEEKAQFDMIGRLNLLKKVIQKLQVWKRMVSKEEQSWRIEKKRQKLKLIEIKIKDQKQKWRKRQRSIILL